MEVNQKKTFRTSWLAWRIFLVALAAFPVAWYWQEIVRYFDSAPQVETPAPGRQVPLIQGEELMARFEAAQQYQPTPEEIAEDAAFEVEQIEQARQWMSDSNPEQRIIGAEQLTAYPTPEAEQLLVDILSKDAVDEVRLAAANSLSVIKTPALKTREALVAALQDSYEEVRFGALNTLQTYLGVDSESSAAKKTLAMLKKQLKSKQVPQETRQAIKDYLLDQFPEN